MKNLLTYIVLGLFVWWVWRKLKSNSKNIIGTNPAPIADTTEPDPAPIADTTGTDPDPITDTTGTDPDPAQTDSIPEYIPGPSYYTVKSTPNDDGSTSVLTAEDPKPESIPCTFGPAEVRRGGEMYIPIKMGSADVVLFRVYVTDATTGRGLLDKKYLREVIPAFFRFAPSPFPNTSRVRIWLETVFSDNHIDKRFHEYTIQR